MKAKPAALILSLLLSAFAGAACSSTGESALTIADMKATYSLTDDVSAHVGNTSSRVLYFYCSAQVKDGSGWKEAVLSIDQMHSSKTVANRKIAPGEQVVVTWKPSEQRAIYPNLVPGTYRLVAYVAEVEKPGVTTQTIYSGPFDLTAPR
jgi:hypothetical protein